MHSGDFCPNGHPLEQKSPGAPHTFSSTPFTLYSVDQIIFEHLH
jgi:hypothetical protein